MKEPKGKEDQKEDGLQTKATLVLDRKISDKKWLDACVIGELRDFKNVLNVSRRLIDRGFRFRVRYIGGRSILWVFESTFESEGFRKSRFFWEDAFYSIKKWSETVDTQARLGWVNVSGVPLNLWNETFFQKLGNLLGEYIQMDKDTEDKSRLDRGRILVMFRGKDQCPSKVKVMDGFKVFTVRIEVDSKLVDHEWVSEILSLNDHAIPEAMEESDQGGGKSHISRSDRW